MTETATPHRPHKSLIKGPSAALRIENLDTDQIMPKQFLRGIDKSGLVPGVLHDLRFDAEGRPRPDFVLNKPAYAATRVLIAGANFGCGSSREHAVWGLQQVGIQAVIAPSFGEIFYSNAMNNGLLLAMLSPAEIALLMDDADDPGRHHVRIDLMSMQVSSASVQASFTLSERHRQMLMQGLDVIGLSLTHTAAIQAFAERHWAAHPWMKDVASTTRQRLDMR